MAQYEDARRRAFQQVQKKYISLEKDPFRKRKIIPDIRAAVRSNYPHKISQELFEQEVRTIRECLMTKPSKWRLT